MMEHSYADPSMLFHANESSPCGVELWRAEKMGTPAALPGSVQSRAWPQHFYPAWLGTMALGGGRSASPWEVLSFKCMMESR